MLRRLDEDATLRGERDREIECAGCRSKLKLVVIEIDRITSAIEYLKEIIPVGCAGCATAAVYLTDHDLIILRSGRGRGSWSRGRTRCRRRRPTWSRSGGRRPAWAGTIAERYAERVRRLTGGSR